MTTNNGKQSWRKVSCFLGVALLAGLFGCARPVLAGTGATSSEQEESSARTTASSTETNATVPDASANGDGAEEGFVLPYVFSPQNTGMSFYVVAFFLLWLPLLGAVATIAIGYVGFRFFAQPTGGIIGLFWLAVTAMVCFTVLIYPLRIVFVAWGQWHSTGRGVAFLLSLLGGALLGAVIYTAVRFFQERGGIPGQQEERWEWVRRENTLPERLYTPVGWSGCQRGSVRDRNQP
jgi:hypothetical protein